MCSDVLLTASDDTSFQMPETGREVVITQRDAGPVRSAPTSSSIRLPFGMESMVAKPAAKSRPKKSTPENRADDVQVAPTTSREERRDVGI